MLPVEKLLEITPSLSELFPYARLLKSAFHLGNRLSRSGGSSSRKSKDHWGGGKTLEAKQCFW